MLPEKLEEESPDFFFFSLDVYLVISVICVELARVLL